MLTLFRAIAILEGISYLLLFAVTMPLKYWAGMGIPNKIIGYVHGALFLSYVVIAILFWVGKKWKFRQLFFLLLASLLPFGTFYLDRYYLKPLAFQKAYQR